MANFNYQDLGIKDYKECWDYQEKLLEEVQTVKKSGHQPTDKNYFLLVEHPHVYTLGKSGDEHNLLIQPEFLKKIHATYYRINRGGDITYHGPGQLVGYPIIDLEYYHLGVKDFIHRMEEAIIAVVARYGIKGERKEGAIGVWIAPNDPAKGRKICAIGVRVSRYVSMHGFALNVNTDMRYFNYINPCGFQSFGVSSIEQELGHAVDFEEVSRLTRKKFNELF